MAMRRPPRETQPGTPDDAHGAGFVHGDLPAPPDASAPAQPPHRRRRPSGLPQEEAAAEHREPARQASVPDAPDGQAAPPHRRRRRPDEAQQPDATQQTGRPAEARRPSRTASGGPSGQTGRAEQAPQRPSTTPRSDRPQRAEQAPQRPATPRPERAERTPDREARQDRNKQPAYRAKAPAQPRKKAPRAARKRLRLPIRPHALAQKVKRAQIGTHMLAASGMLLARVKAAAGALWARIQHTAGAAAAGIRRMQPGTRLKAAWRGAAARLLPNARGKKARIGSQIRFDDRTDARRTPGGAQSRPRGRRTPAWASMRTVLPLAVFGAIFAVSAANIGSYVYDYFSSRSASNALKAAYYAEEDEETPPAASPSAMSGQAGAQTHTPTPAPTPTSGPAATPTPLVPAASSLWLDTQRYPDNPLAEVSNRFSKLQRQNRDIIGWIKIEDLLDEAVVQRDNEYYLRRDYRGYHNVNGSLFLDESCDLSTRPYTLMVYGHNMKTGAMFGCLRNFESASFYHKNPFVTFDTAYENGRYVIFSIATLDVVHSKRDISILSWLNSSSVALREEAISMLQSSSIYTSSVDVLADDQLLLLITCTGEDHERRIVTARRVRDGETEASLLQKVSRARKK